MKAKVLRFFVEFFALCAAIAIACTFIELWAAVAAFAFGGAAMVCYLLWSYYKLDEYAVLFTDKSGQPQKCTVRAMNFAEAEAAAKMYYPEIKTINHTIKLGVEL